MAQITYTDKVAINENPNVADINKVKADDMNEIKSVVNSNETTRENMIVGTQTTSDDNAYSCTYSNKAFGGTILWTNPEPSSVFESQTITLSSNDYDFLEIYYRVSSTNYSSKKIEKGKPTILDGNALSSSNLVNHRNRTMSYVDNSDYLQYSFGTGYQQDTNSSSTTSANGSCIPQYIIGYKTGLV